MPGLGSEIRDRAHALALDKVVLSLLEPAGLSRYIARGLRSFTPNTITAADALTAELEQVRDNGYAVDREEFDTDFCCIAAPILDERGQLLAVLGLSTSSRVFDAERQRLAASVLQVAQATRRLVLVP
jgi:acetyl-CoA synthetase